MGMPLDIYKGSTRLSRIATPMSATGRLESLDSLRGFASLSVMLMHFTTIANIHSLAHTPLRLLLGGHEAVILFFVLSGYVLTLQITSESFAYGGYLLRRFFRIYVPYVFGLAFAAVVIDVLWHGATSSLGDPALQSLMHSTVSDFTSNAMLVFPFDTQRINPVVWTLSYEVRISIVLPLLVFVSSALGASKTLALTFLGSLIVAVVLVHSGRRLETASFAADWLPTLHYLFMFACGHLLASKRVLVASWLQRRKLATGLMIGSAFFYIACQKIATIHDNSYHEFVWDWLITVSVCGMIAALTAPGFFRTLLQFPAFTFLGRISYSLYLYHFVLLRYLFHAIGQRMPLPAFTVLALSASLVVAYAGYAAIEKPSIKFGSKMALWVSSRTVARGAA